MAKPNITGRVPQPLKDEFDEFREDRGLSATDAQRELLRAGLEAKGRDPYAVGEPDDDTEHAAGAELPEQMNMDPRARRAGGVALALALLASVLAAGLGGMIAGALVALAPALAAAGGVLVAISYVPELMEFSTEADAPEPDSATIPE
jgi:hypothetical protein